MILSFALWLEDTPAHPGSDWSRCTPCCKVDLKRSHTEQKSPTERPIPRLIGQQCIRHISKNFRRGAQSNTATGISRFHNYFASRDWDTSAGLAVRLLSYSSVATRGHRIISSLGRHMFLDIEKDLARRN
jgi:hypothetical protein